MANGYGRVCVTIGHVQGHVNAEDLEKAKRFVSVGDVLAEVQEGRQAAAYLTEGRARRYVRREKITSNVAKEAFIPRRGLPALIVGHVAPEIRRYVYGVGIHAEQVATSIRREARFAIKGTDSHFAVAPDICCHVST